MNYKIFKRCFRKDQECGKNSFVLWCVWCIQMCSYTFVIQSGSLVPSWGAIYEVICYFLVSI